MAIDLEVGEYDSEQFNLAWANTIAAIISILKDHEAEIEKLKTPTIKARGTDAYGLNEMIIAVVGGDKTDLPLEVAE